MSTTQVTVNENLVEIDKLIDALNYLLEEINTRKESVLQPSDFDQKIINHIETDGFRNRLIGLIRTNYGDGLYQEVAFRVMEKIDNDIAAFINSRVDERLHELGVVTSSTAGG